MKSMGRDGLVGHTTRRITLVAKHVVQIAKAHMEWVELIRRYGDGT